MEVMGIIIIFCWPVALPPPLSQFGARGLPLRRPPPAMPGLDGPLISEGPPLRRVPARLPCRGGETGDGIQGGKIRVSACRAPPAHARGLRRDLWRLRRATQAAQWGATAHRPPTMVQPSLAVLRRTSASAHDRG